jgi:monothiol glutaredoxin
MTQTINRKIEDIVTSNDVVLFMKGTPNAPKCGFLKAPYKSVDVLVDGEIREGVKAYSSWPTIPQLYVKGEFLGGADIVREMFNAGELTALLVEQDILTDAK